MLKLEGRQILEMLVTRLKIIISFTFEKADIVTLKCSDDGGMTLKITGFLDFVHRPVF
jgi:hypothetical protein